MELYFIDPLVKIILGYSGDTDCFYTSGLLDGKIRNRKIEISDKKNRNIETEIFGHDIMNNFFKFLPIPPINEYFKNENVKINLYTENIILKLGSVITKKLEINLIKINKISIIGKTGGMPFSYFTYEHTPFINVEELTISSEFEKPMNFTTKFLNWFPNINFLKLNIKNAKTIFISNININKNLKYMCIENPESRVFIDYKLLPELQKIYINS